MKRTLTRTLNNTNITITFEYWPAIPANRVHPGYEAEINIVKIIETTTNKELPIPTIEDDGGNGEYEKLVESLFNLLEAENY